MSRWRLLTRSIPSLNLDRYAMGVVAVLCLVALVPLLGTTSPCTHDGDLHYYRVAAMAHALKDGVFFSRYMPDLAFGYGYPFFNYREPVSYYATLALYLIGLPLPLALNLVYAFSILASGLAAYLLARDLFGPTAGLVAGVAYAYAPYQFLNALTRGNAPESVALPLLPFLRDIALPLTGILFVIGGIGAGLMSGAGKGAWKAAWQGFLGIAPAIPLLMMAASVKHIIASGGILDTILHWASSAFTGTSPFASALMIYGLTLVLELFITSGSAKAFLLIPILMPLADLVGVNRQIAVSAYTFGDGFSNMAYPTNAALLITLSLTVISFPKWFKWVLGLWVWVILATVIFLGFAVAFNYGPF